MRSRLPLAVVLLAAFFIRSYSFFCYAYPTGADYGHHTMYADQYRESGRLPEMFPFYQLGRSRWSNLPGGALTYALIAAFAGKTAFALAGITALFGVIEVAGVFFLARRIFERSDTALIASAVAALLPSGALMVAWAGYANLLGLTLMPYGLLAWLAYWREPGARTAVVAIVVLCGIMSIHHLSAMWLGATLVLFALIQLTLHPGESARKLAPIVAGGCFVGLPILLRAKELSELFAAGGIWSGASRFAATRVDWSNWSQTASVFALVFLTGGLLQFWRSRVSLPERLLVGTYAAVSLFFAFGWILGLDFFYVRALYFLSIPSAVGAAALLGTLPGALVRFVTTASIVTALGVGTSYEAAGAAKYYEGLSPGVIEAADWLREFSAPEDVVVVGTSFGYHMPRFLRRPTMVALPPELVGNPDDLEVAEDALSILMGLDGMDAAIDRRNVKFIMVRPTKRDLPDAYRSRAVLAAHPQMTVVFSNADIVIYGVGSL